MHRIWYAVFKFCSTLSFACNIVKAVMLLVMILFNEMTKGRQYSKITMASINTIIIAIIMMN